MSKIINEQHNVSEILWENAPNRAGGGVDAIERRNTPQQAIRTANLDTSTGRVAVATANTLPWHGLGTTVLGAMTALEALELSATDYQVTKYPARYDWNGTPLVSEDTFITVREDTGSALGTVGARYAPLQNRDAFSVLDAFLEKFGAHYESAGALDGGRKVWMLAQFGENWEVDGTADTIMQYVLLTNSHDGSEPVRIYPTNIRVVCANTYNAASAERNRGYSFRHTTNMRTRLADAGLKFQRCARAHEYFRDTANMLARTFVDPNLFFNNILDKEGVSNSQIVKMGAEAYVAGLGLSSIEAEQELRRVNRELNHREKVMTDLQNRYESPTVQLKNISGTAWGAWNAVTEFADHSSLNRYKGTAEARQESRFVSTQIGAAAGLKHRAYEYALTLVS